MDRQEINSNINSVKVKPKFIAQRCPVCNGWKTVGNARKPCDVCGAKGFLEIPVEEVRHG